MNTEGSNKAAGLETISFWPPPGNLDGADGDGRNVGTAETELFAIPATKENASKTAITMCRIASPILKALDQGLLFESATPAMMSKINCANKISRYIMKKKKARATKKNSAPQICSIKLLLCIISCTSLLI